MDCQQVEKEELIEKYVANRLSAAERDAFEEHYFQCAICFDGLQALRAARAALAANQAAGRSEVPSKERHRGWLWGAALATAAALAVMVWWQHTRQGSPAPGPPPVATQPQPGRVPAKPPMPILEELARFEPPSYRPAVLRGSVDEATRKFRGAMDHYLRADYRAAITGLREATGLNPKDPGSLFFLGICHLLAGQADEGIGALRRVVALGETPYLEEAHFYLAKAFLAKGDLPSARGELNATLQMRGDLHDKAQALNRQVEALLLEQRRP